MQLIKPVPHESAQHIKSIPLPPLCELPDNLKFVSGEKITWITIDGTEHVGVMINYDAKGGQFTVCAKDESNSVTLSTEKIKLLTLITKRPYLPISDSNSQSSSHLKLPTGTQRYTLTFGAEDKIEGETRSFHIDRNGIFMFPSHDEDYYTITFTSTAALKNYDIGPRIDEILLDDNLVTTKQIKSSLVRQKESRSQPIGEYLCEKSAVTVMELEKALEHQKTMPHLKLGQILVSENLITAEQLERALDEQKQNRKIPLGEILLKSGLVDQEEIQYSLAKKLGIPFVDLHHFELDEETLQILDEKYARLHNVLPLYHYNSKLVIAVEDPSNWQVLEEIRFQTGMTVEPVMAPIGEIRKVIDNAYTRLSLHAAVECEYGSIADSYEQKETLASENVVITLVNKIITEAHKKGASDIHIETYPGKKNTRIRIRKDGVLFELTESPPQLRKAIIARLKIMASLNVSERRLPQDGKINFSQFSNVKIELRVATLPTTEGLEDAVIRILPHGKPLPLARIGLSRNDHAKLKKLIRNPHGLFLVCGPTGSGKTTTLHSVLGELNDVDRKIWTVEDPVEITQHGLRQLQVNPKIDLNFATALRAFLRADPDIIMVGEMRDSETIHTTVEASLTGHMVFSTLHTNSAAESITRLLDMGLDPFNFADALDGVLAQRLARRICEHCSVKYQASDDELNELLLEYCQEFGNKLKEEKMSEVKEQWRQRYAEADGTYKLRRACGCERCNNTGYNGRIGLYELLTCSEAVKHQVVERASTATIKHIAQTEGMLTLKQDGIEKVLEGHTDIHQIHSECAS